MCSVVFDCFWLSVPVQLIAWKDSSPNDLLCVEWDLKSYTLTHSLMSCITLDWMLIQNDEMICHQFLLAIPLLSFMLHYHAVVSIIGNL